MQLRFIILAAIKISDKYLLESPKFGLEGRNTRRVAVTKTFEALKYSAKRL